jgi:hypothetical protein
MDASVLLYVLYVLEVWAFIHAMQCRRRMAVKTVMPEA